MEITWYGLACFRIRESGVTVVTDPYDKGFGYSLPRLRADIVTCSHATPGHGAVHAIKGDPKVITGPGEYEVRGVFITGIPTSHSAKGGRTGDRTTAFLFDFDGLTVCHLGDLGTRLTEEQVEAIGDVSVLLVPVGGGDTLDGSAAAEVVAQIEPRIAIPMHYSTPSFEGRLDDVSKFLRAMGVTHAEPQESLKITAGNLPEETQVVVLECKQE